jgi:hypothetical protein
VAESDSDVPGIIRMLSARPVPPDTAAAALPRGGGFDAWWAAPDVFPDLPGMPNPADPTVRLLYVGRATSLRGRVLRNHMRRSGGSTLRRTLAGLLMPTEAYRTMWSDRAVLVPEDEARLTAWMRRNTRLTWAEYRWPEDVEDELLWRLVPPLNVSGMDADDVQPSVVAAKTRFDASAKPPTGPDVGSTGQAGR